MTVQALMWALDQRPREPLDKLLLILAADVSDGDDLCWKSVEELAFKACAKVKDVEKSLARLAAESMLLDEIKLHPQTKITSRCFYLPVCKIPRAQKFSRGIAL